VGNVSGTSWPATLSAYRLGFCTGYKSSFGNQGGA